MKSNAKARQGQGNKLSSLLWLKEGIVESVDQSVWDRIPLSSFSQLIQVGGGFVGSWRWMCYRTSGQGQFGVGRFFPSFRRGSNISQKCVIDRRRLKSDRCWVILSSWLPFISEKLFDSPSVIETSIDWEAAWIWLTMTASIGLR